MILSVFLTPYSLFIIPLLYYILPWLRNQSIRDVPGPRVAAFSNLWLLLQCRLGKRYLAVDQAHKKYGPLIRIQPHHVSIADEEAINVVYGHGNGFIKR
jgi:benzoate 4-monooxygenase